MNRGGQLTVSLPWSGVEWSTLAGAALRARGSTTVSRAFAALEGLRSRWTRVDSASSNRRDHGGLIANRHKSLNDGQFARRSWWRRRVPRRATSQRQVTAGRSQRAHLDPPRRANPSGCHDLVGPFPTTPRRSSLLPHKIAWPVHTECAGRDVNSVNGCRRLLVRAPRQTATQVIGTRSWGASCTTPPSHH